MLVVLDSSVWISALQYSGTPLDAVRTAAVIHRIVICPEIMGELHVTLSRKFAWQQEQIQRALHLYLVDALWVHTTGVVRGVCRDPKDDMVLECALLSNADVLVSGDRDLLTMGSFNQTRIMTPRAYMESLPTPII